jgi:hypothetical protein
MNKILMAAVASIVLNLGANLRGVQGVLVAARTRVVAGMYCLPRCRHNHDPRELMAMVAIVKSAEL